MSNLNLERWYRAMKSRDPALLDALLHDEAVFTSPVVHAPQRGKAITKAYLTAASEVLTQDFRYVREFDCGDRAVLEFICTLDGVEVNGVDLIEWDQNGLITDFKVMVRPLKGMQAIHAAMGEMLARNKD